MLCKATDNNSPIAKGGDIPEEEKNLIAGRSDLWSIYIRIIRIISAYFLLEKDIEYAR